jgi:hypothetical protein
VLLLAVHAFATASGRPTIDTLDFLCVAVVFVDWLFFTMCGLAALRLRRTAPASARWRWGGVVAALFAASGALLTAGAVWRAPVPSLAGLGICALGLLAHRLLGGRRAGQRAAGA